MKVIQRSWWANLKVRCRRHWPKNDKFLMNSQKVKIGTLFESDGDWMVELPKGMASPFIEHCRKAGVGFTLINGVYSGLGFASRDLVLFDYDFNVEQLQNLIDSFDSEPQLINGNEEQLFDCHTSR
jgi:hypothetical protein